MDLGCGIRKKTYSGSRIRVQGSKRRRIPDPDPQHWNFFFSLHIHVLRNFLSRTILFHLGTLVFLISFLLRVRPTFSNWIPLPAVLMVNALSMSDGCALSSRIIHSWGNPESNFKIYSFLSSAILFVFVHCMYSNSTCLLRYWSHAVTSKTSGPCYLFSQWYCRYKPLPMIILQ